MPRIDPFFSKQPPFTFIEELKKPLYCEKPSNYGTRAKKPEEIDVSGIYIATPCLDPLLETAWESFVRFAAVYEIVGNEYPVTVQYVQTERPESYKITITIESIRISGDREGIRRALVWLEDQLRRSEAPYLPAGTIERHAVIRSRITRCFFSPINRPPKFGDELSDDIDYYPEEYLNRLMHDGANGIWIYTRFSDLVESSFVSGWGKNREFRIAKLNRVIEKCARYGIGVYVFAIEPYSLTKEEVAKYPQLAGDSFVQTLSDGTPQTRHLICVECQEGRDFVFESGKRLLEAAPNLRGFISITQGERNTSCASVKGRMCPKGNCPARSDGQLLADDVAALASGFHSVDPNFEVVSWTYGAREWAFDDIRDYVMRAPYDVMLMQNFDDMGYEEQLGVMRQCVDYWLSYVGPSELFEITAEQANRSGKHMFAKMQVCCSHEIASVPYVPVPGILFKKYKRARQYQVEGVLQCWYFGNYPSMMSKAAGELAFWEDFSNEKDFLRELAAIWWGYSKAETVVRAWECFEESYRMYPMNVMFSYYGPMHDSVVWKLWLEPKNRKLPRTWQTLDPVDGDRIGECLLQGHMLPEVCKLVDAMCQKWTEGQEIMAKLSACGVDVQDQLSVAKAIGILFDGSRNILEFYRLRDELGRQIGDASKQIDRMEELVYKEIANSKAMLPLCEMDGRLGYHSEGEGYKFFPEKIWDRISQLETLLAEEFPRVRSRIQAEKPPLAYYMGETDKTCYHLQSQISAAKWEKIGETAQFRASFANAELTIDFVSANPTVFMLCPEFQLFTPNVPVQINEAGKVVPYHALCAKLYNSLFGERMDAELRKYAKLTPVKDGYRLQLNLADFGMTDIRPFKMRICAGEETWCPSPDKFTTLGLFHVIPEEYGWMIPGES